MADRRLPVSPAKPLLSITLLLPILALTAGCGTHTMVTSSPLPRPSQLNPRSPLETQTVETESRPPSALDAGRSRTARESYPVAREAAIAWDEEAQLYGVVPFTSIERALAIPLADTGLSWFFRFGVEGSDAEYIVEVRHGEVIGKNELRLPSYIEPPLEDLKPLGKTWPVVDSTEVLEVYLDHNAQLPWVVDYRLVQPTDQGQPIWTLYDANNLAEPLILVDAITGRAIIGR
jgi:hypothetical protein